jgi:hypothetical protein
LAEFSIKNRISLEMLSELCILSFHIHRSRRKAMYSPHAKASDPDTSHEAVAEINITDQALVILESYRDATSLLDVDAYRLAGFPPHACDGQRCSDLRRTGMIVRTGQKAVTPSGKKGHLCRITARGSAYLVSEGL